MTSARSRVDHVVVVGGGLVGLCTAAFLSLEGVAVTVVDRRRVGSGAARINAGWVCAAMPAPLPEPGVVAEALRSMLRPGSPVYLKPRLSPALVAWLADFTRHARRSPFEEGRAALAALNRTTPQRFAELAAAGVDAEFRDGVLAAFVDGRTAERMWSAWESAAPLGLPGPGELLTGDALHEVEPALADGVRAGYVLPNERFVDPDAFVTSLESVLRARDVRFVEHAELRGFEVSGNQVTAVDLSTGRIEGDAFVLAAGAWTPALAARLGILMRLQAGKGYSFGVRCQPTPRHAIHLVEPHVACTPMGDGVRLAGTMELSGLNDAVVPARVDAIMAGASVYLRGVDPDSRTPAAVGPRPVTSDGLPIIGSTVHRQNVYLATGHGMWGLTLGPATGAAVAELIVHGSASVPLAAFHPDRFRIVRRPGARRSPTRSRSRRADA